MARRDRSAVEHERRNIETASAITVPGMFLSQPAKRHDGRRTCGRAATSSMESAITSRLISEAFMPSRAHGDAVVMEMVLNSIGVPPAARMPSFTAAASVAKVEVAGADLGPGVGDSDDGLVQVFLREANAAEIGARRGAVRALGQRDAVVLADCAFRWSRYCSCIYLYLRLLQTVLRCVQVLERARTLDRACSNSSSGLAWRSVRPMSSRPSSRQ